LKSDERVGNTQFSLEDGVAFGQLDDAALGLGELRLTPRLLGSEPYRAVGAELYTRGQLAATAISLRSWR
jgi:hypothetical protein